jgi:GTP cyclohydrolase IA
MDIATFSNTLSDSTSDIPSLTPSLSTSFGVSPSLEAQREAIAYHVKQILHLVGEDVTREGLLETPRRVAKSYEELLQGYLVEPSHVLTTTFEESSEGPVIVADITFHSLCEHHMIPFFGIAHVGYVPGHRIVGISKIARLVDVFARRLQVQERLTKQIVDTLFTTLQAEGAIALIEAEHMCMCARGIRKPGSKTITMASRGMYQTDVNLRNEFLQLVQK